VVRFSKLSRYLALFTFLLQKKLANKYEGGDVSKIKIATEMTFINLLYLKLILTYIAASFKEGISSLCKIVASFKSDVISISGL